MLFEVPLKIKIPNSIGFPEKFRLLFNIIGVKKLPLFSKNTIFVNELCLYFKSNKFNANVDLSEFLV